MDGGLEVESGGHRSRDSGLTSCRVAHVLLGGPHEHFVQGAGFCWLVSVFDLLEGLSFEIVFRCRFREVLKLLLSLFFDFRVADLRGFLHFLDYYWVIWSVFFLLLWFQFKGTFHGGFFIRWKSRLLQLWGLICLTGDELSKAHFELLYFFFEIWKFESVCLFQIWLFWDLRL